MRRNTEVKSVVTTNLNLRESDSSLNDRSSTIEEGNVGSIQPSISSGKCHSDVRVSAIEEVKVSYTSEEETKL